MRQKDTSSRCGQAGGGTMNVGRPRLELPARDFLVISLVLLVLLIRVLVAPLNVKKARTEISLVTLPVLVTETL
jgi:hypothetical protein